MEIKFDFILYLFPYATGGYNVESESDIQAWKSVGIQSILIESDNIQYMLISITITS